MLSLLGYSRERRTAKEGSEDITVELDIAAGDFEIVDYSKHPVAKKYLPLNELIVINDGSTKLKIYYNQTKDDFDIVPAGGVLSKDNKAIRSLKVENLDSSNAGHAVIHARKRPMKTDDLIRKLIP